MDYLLILILVGYILGCIHGSQIVGFIKKVDIRNQGVKNAGASNAALVLGWKSGLFVGFVDILKGSIAIIIAHFILQSSYLSEDMYSFLIYITAFFVVIGHNYPINMKFKGGKGTATMLGVLLAIDWKVAVISILLFMLFSYITDYLVLGVLFLYIPFIVTTHLFTTGIEPTVIAILLTFISIIKHIDNYKRILEGNEIKISTVIKKKG